MGPSSRPVQNDLFSFILETNGGGVRDASEASSSSKGAFV